MRKQPTMFKGDFVINNKGCEGVVVKYLNASEVLVEFLDENRYRNWFEAKDIRGGVFKNPFIPTVEGTGFIGDGVHSTRLSGKQCPVHKVWSDMFIRCYSKNARKNGHLMRAVQSVKSGTTSKTLLNGIKTTSFTTKDTT